MVSQTDVGLTVDNPLQQPNNANDFTGTEDRHEELDKDRWPPIYTRMIAAMAALNSCNIGYDLGVNTGLASSFQRDDGNSLYMSNIELEMYMGALSLSSIFGALLMFTISDPYGRRGVFFFSQIIILSGLIITVSSNTYGVLVFGRLFTGFGVGLGFAADPLYISEISPKRFRGQLVSWSETATNIGILLGFCCCYAVEGIHGNAQWKVLVAIGMVLPIVLIILVIFVIPESPRWLMINGRKAEAISVLQKCSNASSSEKGAQLGDKLENDIKKELEASASITWTSLFNDPLNIKKLKTGVGVAVAGSLTGVTGVQYYMFKIFDGSGITSKSQQYQALIVVGICKVMVISVAGYLFDKIGRRPPLIISCLGMAGAFTIIAVMHNNQGGFSSEAVAVVGFLAVVAYVSFFSFGMGPGAWLIPSEVFSNDIRTNAMSLSSFCNRAVSTIIAFTFLTLETNMGFGVYVLFGVFNIFNAIFIFYMLPETRGKNLEEMNEVFKSF